MLIKYGNNCVSRPLPAYPLGLNSRVLKIRFVLFLILSSVCEAGDAVLNSRCFLPPGATTHTNQTCCPAGLWSIIFCRKWLSWHKLPLHKPPDCNSWALNIFSCKVCWSRRCDQGSLVTRLFPRQCLNNVFRWDFSTLTWSQGLRTAGEGGSSQKVTSTQ